VFKISRRLSAILLVLVLSSALPASAASDVERGADRGGIGARVERIVKAIKQVIVRIVRPSDAPLPPHP
jgi:hypothetical protein